MKYRSIRLLLPLFVTTFCVKAADTLAPETHPEVYTPYGHAGISDWQTLCQQRKQHLAEFYDTVDKLNQLSIDAHGAVLLSDVDPSDWKACQERNQHLTNPHRHSAAVYCPATVTKKNRLPRDLRTDIECYRGSNHQLPQDIQAHIAYTTHSKKQPLSQDLLEGIRYYRYSKTANSCDLLDELNCIHQKIETAESASSIDPLITKRKRVLQKLAFKAGLISIALDEQDKHVLREQAELSKITAELANYTVPSTDLVFYLHGLLEWYTTYKVTPEKKDKLTNQEKIAHIFEPGELYLDRISDTKKIPAVKETTKKFTLGRIPVVVEGEEKPKSHLLEETNTIHAVAEHEHTFDLNSIPQRHVIKKNEAGNLIYQTDVEGNFMWQPREGKLPLEVCADFAEQTYKGWYRAYISWNTPKETIRLMDVEKDLLQVDQDFAKATDVSTRTKLATKKKELTTERDGILHGIKSKVLALMQSNIGEYSSNPDRGLLGLIAKRDNTQARIAAEQEDMKELNHLARILFYVTADDRADGISTQQAISNLVAKKRAPGKPISYETLTKLAQATDKMIALINNTDDYILEQPSIELSAPAEEKKDQPQVASSSTSTEEQKDRPRIGSTESSSSASVATLENAKKSKSQKRRGKGKAKAHQPSVINS